MKGGRDPLNLTVTAWIPFFFLLIAHCLYYCQQEQTCILCKKILTLQSVSIRKFTLKFIFQTIWTYTSSCDCQKYTTLRYNVILIHKLSLFSQFFSFSRHEYEGKGRNEGLGEQKWWWGWTGWRGANTLFLFFLFFASFANFKFSKLRFAPLFRFGILKNVNIMQSNSGWRVFHVNTLSWYRSKLRTTRGHKAASRLRTPSLRRYYLPPSGDIPTKASP